MGNNYCIIGLGNHSSTKIIPALELKKKNIIGVVSKKTKQNDFPHRVFKNILQAINDLPPETIFVVSTPPKLHFKQIKVLLANNRNVYVEKPIFTSLAQVNKTLLLLPGKDVFISETLMYKHTFLYNQFINIWKSKKLEIKKIICNFTIPSFPLNTFRDKDDVSSSCLYDIGCYIISLLVDLKIVFYKIEVIQCVFDKKKLLSLKFKCTCKNFVIESSIGLGEKYENIVELQLENDKHISFNPFFYGRKTKKFIITKKNGLLIDNIIINDEDAYTKMFNITNKSLLKSQNKRFNNLLKVNEILEKMSKDVFFNNN